MRHLSYAVLALVMCLGFAMAAVPGPSYEPAAPRPSQIFHKATAEESLIRQLKRAYEMDQLTASTR